MHILEYRRCIQSITLITGQCACDLTWTREIERNGAMAREKLQITRRYFERHIGKAQRVNRMSARQRTERERKKKAPRGGRACIFDNYSTVDLRADGLRTGGGGGEVNGGMNEQVGRKGGQGSRRDCGVAGLVSESRVQPSGSYEYIIWRAVSVDSDRMEHRSWLAHPFGPFSCVRMRHACNRAIAVKIKNKKRVNKRAHR